MENDLIVQPLRAEGTCKLLIENNTVKVVSSNCPLNICIQMGVIKDANQWIACLPHKIFISITGTEKLLNQADNIIDTIVY